MLTTLKKLEWLLLSGVAGCSANPSNTVSAPAEVNREPVRAPERLEARPQARAEEPVPAVVGPLPIEVVPARLRNAYPSHSARGAVQAERTADGWELVLRAAPSTDPNRGEWAGFCWQFAPVNATGFSRLVIDLPAVTQTEEVEVKLEQQDNIVQETVLRRLEQGQIRVDLSSYARVRPEVARLCIMAIGRPTAKGPSTASFALARAFLE